MLFLTLVSIPLTSQGSQTDRQDCFMAVLDFSHAIGPVKYLLYGLAQHFVQTFMVTHDVS